MVRASGPVPVYARVAIPLLLVLLIGRLVWRAPASHGSVDSSTGTLTLPPGPSIAPWQRDVADSLAKSIRNSEAGDITAAEVAVDRAESLITAARLQNSDAKPQFFADVNASLDSVIDPHLQEATLFDHVTEARVSLAELRSSQAVLSAQTGATELGPVSGTSTSDIRQGPSSRPTGDIDTPPVVRIAAPREIAAKATLNARSLGADYLNATLMPDNAEILLPPSTRAFTDGIRVEGITISGASQTLDGIRWRNVTFIGTRLRYEGGDLDLQNVQFVRCRFGFPSDERGARLASAIALGQSSISFTGPTLAPIRP